jgi:hypothetical protein
MQTLPKSELERNLDRVKRELGLLKFHVETLKSLLQKKEDKIYSKLTDQDGNKLVNPASMMDEKNLQERYDYVKLGLEALDLEQEIDSKKKLIEQYELHVERTKQEGPRPVTDAEIRSEILKMMNMKLTGKLKERAIEMRNNFESHKISGIESRFDFLEGIKKFISQNS